jgi:superfamily I DNA/RNA helicase
MIQTGYQSGRPTYGNDQIRKMQSNVTSELANVYIAYSGTSSFAEKNWMKDHVHYNQNGLNDIGLKSAKLVAKILKL